MTLLPQITHGLQALDADFTVSQEQLAGSIAKDLAEHAGHAHQGVGHA